MTNKKEMLYFEYKIRFVSLCRRLRDNCGNSSVGRVLASQAEGHGFESRLPLM